MTTTPATHEFVWVADRCLRVRLGEGISAESHSRVRAAYGRLCSLRIAGVADLTPAYDSLLVTFDPATLDAQAAERAVRAALAGADAEDRAPPRLVTVPTCYEGACGPDLHEVALLRRMTPEEVVSLHASAEYVVHFLGFSPGFPYLAGLPERLATPRLERPRLAVPAGSVAIAGTQAGIYPQATPGGWRLLGRTPLRLFDAGREPPNLLAIGDHVRFAPIPHEDHVARDEQTR